MIGKDLESKIIFLYKTEKWPRNTIAREIGVHKSAVRRVLENNPETAESISKSRLIDPYIPFLQETLKEHPELKASRLFQMVVERGFTGGSDHFRTIIRTLRPEKKYEAFTRITVLQGEQAQVDWACFGKIKIGNTTRNLYAFVMVLSWSRQIFLKYFMSMEMGCFLQGHVDAFSFFNGVPRKILCDNLKSAVLERHNDIIKFNERYLNFATHYRFLPKPCNVRRGNEKGRVERAIRYVRDNFFGGRKFRDISDLNQQAHNWCTGIAGKRRCLAEPIYTVQEAFEREKSKLLPLPNDSYPIYTRDLVKVGKTNYARFDKNDYSVPGEYVRKQLSVQANADRIDFCRDDKIISSHNRCWSNGETITNKEHTEEILQRKSKLSYSHNIKNLEVLLPNAKLFLEKAAAQGLGLGRAVQNLHNCLDDYGIDLMTEGINIALDKAKVSITDLRIIVEKLIAQKGKKNPLTLSAISEEKSRQLSITKPDLAKYDTLGGDRA